LETIFLNLFFHSNLEAMEPKVSFFDGKIIVIRPLIYVRERDIVDFVKLTDFPSFICECPYSKDSKRALVKDFVRRVEPEVKHFRNNIWKASRKWLEFTNFRNNVPNDDNKSGE